MAVAATPTRRNRPLSIQLVCVGIVALQAVTATSAFAQGKEICAASRPGFELCERRASNGAVDIERAVASPRKVAMLLVRPGTGSERLAQRAISEAFTTNAVPTAARPILRNALEQCVRNGAEISSRIGPTEWLFVREAGYVCVVRIGFGSDNIRRAAAVLEFR